MQSTFGKTHSFISHLLNKETDTLQLLNRYVNDFDLQLQAAEKEEYFNIVR